MRLFLLVILVVGVLAAVLVAPASARDASRAAPSRDALLDLAAMILSPTDLDALGLRDFGLANLSSLRDAETDAFLQADGDEQEYAARLVGYRDAGFRARYVGSLLRPSLPLARLPSGLLAADMRVSTAVTEYASPEGAAEAFALAEGLLDDAPGRDVPGTQQFGVQTDLTRSIGTEEETGEPFQRLELAFRLDNLVAEATIVDYRNVEPDVATVEQLAGALLERIERVRSEGGAHLSSRVLRLAPLVRWIERGRLRDFYTRLDGDDRLTFAQAVAAIRGATPPVNGTPGPTSRAGSLPPIDTYMFWSPVGEGDPLALPLYVVWLDRFGSEQEAAEAMQDVSANLGEGYFDVRERPEAGQFGDESRVFAYSFRQLGMPPVHGHVVIARTGDTIVRLQIDGPRGVTLEEVESLAGGQLQCLATEIRCEPVPSPESPQEPAVAPTDLGNAGAGSSARLIAA